jgi:chorismate mutase
MAAGIKIKDGKSQEEQILKTIEECCNEKELDSSLRDKIIKTVIEKYKAKTGGE